MTSEHMLRFVAKTNGRPPSELVKMLEIVYDAVQIRKPDSEFYSAHPTDGEPEEVKLHVTVLADDEAELDSATHAMLNAFHNFGVEIIGDPEVRSCKPVEPVVVQAPGLSYDETTQELTIDLQAAARADIELRLFASKDQVRAIIADNGRGRRVEQAVKLRKITLPRSSG